MGERKKGAEAFHFPFHNFLHCLNFITLYINYSMKVLMGREIRVYPTLVVLFFVPQYIF